MQATETGPFPIKCASVQTSQRREQSLSQVAAPPGRSLLFFFSQFQGRYETARTRPTHAHTLLQASQPAPPSCTSRDSDGEKPRGRLPVAAERADRRGSTACAGRACAANGSTSGGRCPRARPNTSVRREGSCRRAPIRPVCNAYVYFFFSRLRSPSKNSEPPPLTGDQTRPLASELSLVAAAAAAGMHLRSMTPCCRVGDAELAVRLR